MGKKEHVKIRAFDEFITELVLTIISNPNLRPWYEVTLKEIFSSPFTPIKNLYRTGAEYRKLQRLFELGIIKRRWEFLEGKRIMVVYPSWTFAFRLKKILDWYTKILKRGGYKIEEELK